MTLHLTVNLAFWQLLRQYQPKLAKIIKPELKRIQQTFPVKIFDNTKGSLQMPFVLPEIVQKLNEDGKKTRQSDIKSPPIFSRFKLNIVTVVAGALACICSKCNTDFINQTIQTSITSFKFGVSKSNPSSKSILFGRNPTGKYH